MQPLELRARRLQIPMRTRFKHASAERKVADSVWVEARRGAACGLGEGCPRDYVTGESGEGALAWIEARRDELASALGSLESLRAFAEANREAIDANPAAWCAVEIAALDLLGCEAGKPVEALLGLPESRGPFRYSAVVSDEPLERTDGLLTLYLAAGFRDFKFKVSGDLPEDRSKLALLVRKCDEGGHGTPRIRVDANNLWAGDPDAAAAHLEALGAPLFGVEEPLGARDVEGLSALSQRCALPIILDESLCRREDAEPFAGRAGRWIGNVRVSKMGGILRSLEVVERIRALGWPVIVGAQVGETSVLTRAALIAATAGGEGLTAQEGAFGTLLLARDAVEPVLQFGEGATLELPEAVRTAPGLGLAPAPDAGA